jgi:serine/threonine-protein kinase HipA
MRSERVDLVVYLDAPELGPCRPVGVLTRWPGAVLSTAFAYARSWLDDPTARFAIDPAMPLGEAQLTIPARRLPGILSDTAPDKWGEALMVRRAGGRSLDAWDFLVGVAAETRMGALRLRDGVDGPFIADREPAVPPVHRLAEIQELARRFEEDPADVSVQQISLLAAPGSSLGGARPKANFIEPDGTLWIAKFPSKTDRRDVAAWEHVYARLAGDAGIEVPPTRLLSITGEQRTFATRRFDRTEQGRRLYASAVTMTANTDARAADYIDIGDAISRHTAAEFVRAALEQLYRRMTFNVLAGNRDDHLRNHGFLRHADGWRLAPAFDLNPAREMREHAIAVNGRTVAPTASDVLDVRGFFGLSDAGARSIVREVAAAVSQWREVASATQIGRSEQDQVAVALAALETAANL